MPPKATLVILSDSPKHEKTAEVLSRCWNWRASPNQLEIIHRLVSATFSRAAGIIAVIIASFAKCTGRLQPALGGVTVAMGGSLGTNKFYQNLVRSNLEYLFDRNTAELIQFIEVEEAPAEGAAILNCMIQRKMV